MADEVFFYRLSRKFVDEQFDVPEEAKEVMYYSLAIGHHLASSIACEQTWSAR